MTRINPLSNPTGKSAEMLEMVQKKMGRVPNMLATLAHSPAALEMYLSMSAAAGNMSLNAKTREAVAIFCAEKNSCDYCGKAHAFIGKAAGLSDSDIEQAKAGQAQDPKTQAVLTLTTAILDKKGFATQQDMDQARTAGLTDGELLEVVATTCLNIYTNYINHMADPQIDF